MLNKVRLFIDKHHLIETPANILVAVSGGADSVALLHVLSKLANQMQLKLTVVHLNHMIRGKAADADEDFVKQYAASLNIPCISVSSNVPQQAVRKGVSIEMAARNARYKFFSKAARKTKASAVVTAHNSNDQAETIILKLARGAGPTGMSGIAITKIIHGLKVIRPMLDVSRRDVISYLKTNQLIWREDESNSDVSFLRNRVRREILPSLEKQLNPEIINALNRTAAIFRSEDEWLSELTAKLLPRCISQDEDNNDDAFSCLDIHRLQDLPLAAMRRVIRTWLASTGIPIELLSFDLTSHIEELIYSKKGAGTVTAGGNYRIRKSYNKLSIVAKQTNESTGACFKHKVAVPGETIIAEVGLRIVTHTGSGLIKQKTVRAGILPAQASIGCYAIRNRNIYARSWRDGDKMDPLGMKGSKKLQDIFVDDKVPVHQRKSIPVFECGSEIVWIPGYRVAKGWEIKNEKDRSVHIEVSHITTDTSA